MYYLFYLISLLPWRILYIISDFFYAITYYVIGYRKQVTLANLALAFPEKTEKERIRIAKDFYHKFIDTFIETIKLLSVSRKEFDKRCTGNFEVINDLYASGQSVQMLPGHFFNWEFLDLGLSANIQYPFLAVYVPPKGKGFNQLILKLRQRYGGLLIPATAFAQTFKQLSLKQYALMLIADQNPSNPNQAYWLPFFGKMAPFVTGPEKGGKKMNTAFVFVNFYATKRGYYTIECELCTTTPNDLPEGEITKRFVQFLEKSIQKNPANYLWSHRRWKWEYDASKHQHLVIHQ